LCSASLCSAQDLSVYRNFKFGESPEVIGKNLSGKTPDLTVVHRAPALIEEFEWNSRPTSEVPPAAESLASIRFSFYNSELFKMVIKYDPEKTEGLTDEDIIEGISRQYGKPSMPEMAVVTVSSFGSFVPDSQKVLARWDNDQYSYSLYRSSYPAILGVVAVSKTRAVLAATAAEKSIAQQRLDAAQSEVDRRKQLETDRREAQEKGRLANKPNFRP